MESQLNQKLKISLYTDDKCFGPGISELLDIIEKTGSLRSATIEMGMAYSKAWKILKNCEEKLGFKLLISKAGGRNGGGAMVTDEAKIFNETYKQYCKELKNFSNELFCSKFESYLK